jgi:uroporphyrinogen-III synthase
VLPHLLKERGALIDEVDVYRTVVPSKLSAKVLSDILQSGIDLVIFTSPSTVRNFVQRMHHRHRADCLQKIRAACIGPVTRETAETLGLNVRVTANVHTIDGLVEAIVNAIRDL